MADPGVTKAGLLVQLPHYGTDGFVPVSTLGEIIMSHEPWVLIANEPPWLQLADAVSVKLVDVARSPALRLRC
jgi:ribonuclease R